jgi:hypothetical protein
VTIDKRERMGTGFVNTALRALAWCCVVILAVLSLLPARAMAMVQTGFPGVVNHFVAYAGSAVIAVAGYGASLRGSVWIIGGFWVYGGVLGYLQHFSPGRNRRLPISWRRGSAPCVAVLLSLLCCGAFPPNRAIEAATANSRSGG